MLHRSPEGAQGLRAAQAEELNRSSHWNQIEIVILKHLSSVLQVGVVHHRVNHRLPLLVSCLSPVTDSILSHIGLDRNSKAVIVSTVGFIKAEHLFELLVGHLPSLASRFFRCFAFDLGECIRGDERGIRRTRRGKRQLRGYGQLGGYAAGGWIAGLGIARTAIIGGEWSR